MADKITEDELKVEKTEGFKVGEKKTLDEYLKLGMLMKCIVHVFLSWDRDVKPMSERLMLFVFGLVV
jgi:hypothetical protein